MAAVDELIAQIEDKPLRDRLRTEADRIIKEKRFGLVFEEHLPELTPIFGARVRTNCKVARRSGALEEIWRVTEVRDGAARCRSFGTGETQTIQVDELVVVREFGEAIFPTLVPVDRVQNGVAASTWHALIEADNYHALQLLEYIHAGEVDCIYIDPPYNSGARDWKYNNDYVDGKDSWRHSKWLAFMRRRLRIAKRLLKDDGVLIVTIDENEVHHLGCLLEQEFRSHLHQMVTIVINPKGTGKHNFARVEEYALFCIPNMGRSTISGISADGAQPGDKDGALDNDVDGSLDDTPSFDPETGPSSGLWELRHARRGGSESSYRHQRPNQFFPIFIDEASRVVVEAGQSIPTARNPSFRRKRGLRPIWPSDNEGNHRCWRFTPQTMQRLIEQGRVVLGRYNRTRDSWTLNIWFRKNQVTKPKTVWWNTRHDAGTHGTTLLHNLLAKRAIFPFPKSVYAVRDCLATVVGNRKDALVLDFFAGSGTTLHAVNLLNVADDGSRRCILVTNNEVSEADAKRLAKAGLRPGDAEWEAEGICRCVTWPRAAFTIRGERGDGSALAGECFTGRTAETEKPRRVRQIGFTRIEQLNTAAKKKQLVALIEGIPQSKVSKETPFFVSEGHGASILFDESQAETWLEALQDQEHIVEFYVVTPKRARFVELKARIEALLGPVTVREEQKRSMREGFPANVEYFRLGLLERSDVVLRRQFREILPILWLRAGAVGPRPELARNRPVPDMLIPAQNPFAVLVEETRFPAFYDELRRRPDLTYAFLVTDSEDAYLEMAERLNVPNVIQLYRDFLENFVLNRETGAS